MKKLQLLLSVLVTCLYFSCTSTNPEYKEYLITNNDTIAEIYIPKGYVKHGYVILWSNRTYYHWEIEQICYKLLLPEKCIRDNGDSYIPKMRPDLLIYIRNKEAQDETYYIYDNPNYIYLCEITNYPESYNKKDVEIYKVLTKKEADFRKFLEFDYNEFKINGKLVTVKRSEQYWVSFYSKELLTSAEMKCIRLLILKYTTSFITKGGYYVDNHKRSLNFFKTDYTDWKPGAYGCYATISGPLLINYDFDNSIDLDDVKINLKEGETIEDWIEIIEQDV